MKKLICLLFFSLLFNGNVIAKKLTSYDDLDLASKPKEVLSKEDKFFFSV